MGGEGRGGEGRGIGGEERRDLNLPGSYPVAVCVCVCVCVCIMSNAQSCSLLLLLAGAVGGAHSLRRKSVR